MGHHRITRSTPSAVSPRFVARGFTLLEVMVALSVLAIALGSAIRASINATQTITDLRQRTIAGWVVENQIATMRARKEWPPLGTTQGETVMLGQTMYWRKAVERTPAPIFRRVTITANTEPSDTRYMSKLVALLPKISR